MNETMEVIHVRLPKSLAKRLDHWAVEEDKNRQQAVVTLLQEALDARKFLWVKS